MAKYIDESEPAPGWQWVRIPTQYLGEQFDDAGNGETVVDWVVIPDRLRFTRGKRTGDGFEAVLSGQIRLHSDGRIEWREVTFHGVVHAGVVRALSLEGVGVDELARHAKHENFAIVTNPEGLVGFSETKYDEVEHGSADDRAARKALRGRGRPPVPYDDLERAAAAYREAPDKPVQYVARQLGLSDRTAARRIEKARERGLLPPTTPGKVTR